MAGAGTGSAATGAAGAGEPGFCSGCAREVLNTMDMTIHLHHVHMNVAKLDASHAFYEKHLAAERVKLNGVSDALQAKPILILADETATAPASQLPTAFQHIGWGSADPVAWYTKAHAEGVMPDTRKNTLFMTNETPTVGMPGSGANTFALLGVTPPPCFPIQDQFSYMYVLGPDQERIEVWTGEDLRVNHLHFTTPDLAATVRWYQTFLGLPATSPGQFFAFFLDDILFFFEPIAGDYAITDEHVMGHVAFSVTDLDPWLQRAKDQGVTVVSEPAEVHGFKSFFVRGPDGLLLELVQAAPSKELCLP